MSRWMFRLLLVGILLGVAWLGYYSWLRGRPNFYWHRAQAAIADGDTDAAKNYLRNLLLRVPEHGEGHRTLANLYLDEAIRKQEATGFTDCKLAFMHLTQASIHLPDDIQLQKQLLGLFLESRRIREAGLVARRVAAVEPDNVEAALAMAWRAVVVKRRVDALKYLARLDELPNRPLYQTWALHVQLSIESGDLPAAQTTFDELCQHVDATAAREDAGGGSANVAEPLPSSEVETRRRLLLMSVEQAPDLATAHRRAATVVSFFEGPSSNETGSVAASADGATQAMLLLELRHPIAADKTTSADARSRAELTARVERLRAAAIRAGQGSPLVYHHSAVAAFQRGDHAETARLLDQGLRLAKEAPDARASELLELHVLAARNHLVQGNVAEVRSHVTVLLEHEDSAGWGNLLAGAVDVEEGRHERALRHFQAARRTLGATPLVQLSLANSHLALGDWTAALPILRQLESALDPANAEQRAWADRHHLDVNRIRLGQLRCHLGLDQWDEASPLLEELTNTASAPAATAATASFLASKQRLEEAERLLAQVRGRHPHDLTLLDLQSRILVDMGRAAEANALVEQFASTHHEDLAAQLVLARWRGRQGRADEAAGILAAVRRRFPEKVAPLIGQFQSLLDANRTDEAIALAQSLGTQDADAPLAEVLRALAEIKRGNLNEAASHLDAAARGGTPREVTLLRGELAAAQGDFATAVRSANQSLDVTPLRRRAETMLLNSILLVADKEGPEQASALLDQVIADHPDEFAPLVARAELQFRLGRFAAAMATLEQMERLAPNSPTPLYLRAVALFRQGKTREAELQIEQLLDQSPDYLPAKGLAAEILARLRRFDEALAAAEAVLESKPGMTSMLVVRAESLDALDQPQAAIAILDELARKTPGDRQVTALLATIHAKRGDVSRALAVYQDAQAAAPGDVEFVVQQVKLLGGQKRTDHARLVAERSARQFPRAADWIAISRALAESGDFEAARDWSRRAARMGQPREQATAYLLLGEIALHEHGRSPAGNASRELLGEARDQFRRALELDPHNYIAGNNLAWLLATEFEAPADAVQICERLKGATPLEHLPDNLLDTMATAYLGAGQAAEAEQVLRQAIGRRPEQSSLHLQLGELLADAGQWSDARRSLERALQLGLPDRDAPTARQRLERVLQSLRESEEAEREAREKKKKPKEAIDVNKQET